MPHNYAAPQVEAILRQTWGPEEGASRQPSCTSLSDPSDKAHCRSAPRIDGRCEFHGPQILSRSSVTPASQWIRSLDGTVWPRWPDTCGRGSGTQRGWQRLCRDLSCRATCPPGQAAEESTHLMCRPLEWLCHHPVQSPQRLTWSLWHQCSHHMWSSLAFRNHPSGQRSSLVLPLGCQGRTPPREWQTTQSVSSFVSSMLQRHTILQSSGQSRTCTCRIDRWPHRPQWLNDVDLYWSLRRRPPRFPPCQRAATPLLPTVQEEAHVVCPHIAHNEYLGFLSQTNGAIGRQYHGGTAAPSHANGILPSPSLSVLAFDSLRSCHFSVCHPGIYWPHGAKDPQDHAPGRRRWFGYRQLGSWLLGHPVLVVLIQYPNSGKWSLLQQMHKNSMTWLGLIWGKQNIHMWLSAVGVAGIPLKVKVKKIY